MFSFQVIVNDGNHPDVSAPYDITIVSEAVNSGPAFITDPNPNSVADLPYYYDAEATDPDGDTVWYSLVEAPAEMSIDRQTGLVVWTPAKEDVGDHAVTIRAVDSLGLSADQQITLTVRALNTAPILVADPPRTTVVGEVYEFDFDATDLEGHTIFYSYEPTPAGGTPPSGPIFVHPDTGVLTWTPDQTGLQRLQINIEDEYELGMTYVYDVEVVSGTPTGTEPPVITSPPPALSAELGVEYTYELKAHDLVDLTDTVVISMPEPSTLLTGMSFNATDGTNGTEAIGTLTWTPTEGTARLRDLAAGCRWVPLASPVPLWADDRPTEQRRGHCSLTTLQLGYGVDGSSALAEPVAPGGLDVFLRAR